MSKIKKSQLRIGDKLLMNKDEVGKYYKRVSKETGVNNPKEIEDTFYEMYKNDSSLDRYLTKEINEKGKEVYSLNLIGFINHIKTL